MKTLTLSLKTKWFEMIKAGVKLEEYREITDYWKTRLIYGEDIDRWGNYEVFFNNFDKLVFSLGYPKVGDTSRRLEFNAPKIRIGEGRQEWGAEPGKLYFVITWER